MKLLWAYAIYFSPLWIAIIAAYIVPSSGQTHTRQRLSIQETQEEETWNARQFLTMPLLRSDFSIKTREMHSADIII